MDQNRTPGVGPLISLYGDSSYHDFFCKKWKTFSMQDIWITVPQEPHLLEVNAHGEIRSKYSGELRSFQYTKKGYATVSAGKVYVSVLGKRSGRRRKYKVHRLVANAFVHNPMPLMYTQINHIDGDKKNNRASNLEWCDCQHNMNEAWKMGLYKKGKGSYKGPKRSPRGPGKRQKSSL